MESRRLTRRLDATQRVVNDLYNLFVDSVYYGHYAGAQLAWDAISVASGDAERSTTMDTFPEAESEQVPAGGGELSPEKLNEAQLEVVLGIQTEAGRPSPGEVTRAVETIVGRKTADALTATEAATADGRKLTEEANALRQLRRTPWDQLNVWQQVERMREIVKSQGLEIELLQVRFDRLQQRIRALEKHHHADGKVLVPVPVQELLDESGMIERGTRGSCGRVENYF